MVQYERKGETMQKREHFSSRLGFILISAGCAVGLGNVWRFPYITGKYGGAAFVLLYLIFLLILGLPIMAMEFSVGRASQKSAAKSFDVLQPPKSKWHRIKFLAISGNYLLMMFYTTIGGWMLNYAFKMASGQFQNKQQAQISNVFDSMTKSPFESVFWMILTVCIGIFICSRGLVNGVEKASKYMMSFLFVIMIILLVRSLTLPNAWEGLQFYLIPDFDKLLQNGLGEALFAAMGQAFFTLSIGMGSLAIFGSYIDKKRNLLGESISVCLLDTSVALLAGCIIFPACFAFSLSPGSGPGLVFITLPNVFNQMVGGQIWGTLFFIFMSFAALTTIIAVFENIMSFFMDYGFSRKASIRINFVLILLLSLPCALGFNLFSFIQPLGAHTNIQDLQDFIVSNNILPLGSILYILFCTTRYGWGWNQFISEVNAGKGLRFPKQIRYYMLYVVPFIILIIFFQGYINKFDAPYNYLFPILIFAILATIPLTSYRQLKQQKNTSKHQS